jgi:glucokinase
MQYLGIEIGGTKLQLGIGPGDGTLKALWRGPVDVATGADGIREQITQAVPELLQKAGLSLAQLQGVGIGFGGPVDDSNQTVIKSHQIEGWDGFPLADWISEMVGLPAALGNDADCAGLAEALFGAGKGLSPIFYITIGSGIGGGLIINGEIYRGCGRGAAEIGHTDITLNVINLGDTYQGLPSGGILEHRASGWAIGSRARFEIKEVIGNPRLADHLLHLVNGRLEELSANHVAQAAASGDSLALRILRDTWTDLAVAIRNMIALLSPRRIIIGGGVSLMGEKLLFEPLRQMVAERVFRPFANCYDIVPAALGEEVVIHGALALARRRLGEHATAKRG